ncbi:TetR/AcrR family transcriptional regulator [Saccharibacillus sacchari]|uniref:WHG domain-containing protein n=1 Tax=Saccharibacillus sacchari TaxID=456493 RepID=A0ACC6PF89_9BACL
MVPRNRVTLPHILQAAATIVDTDGVDALTMSSLAQKLGIRSPSLYNHSEGLPDIRRRLAVSGLEQLRDALMRSTVGRSRDEAIREMAKSYLNFVRTRPGLYEITILAPTDLDDELQKVSQEIVDLVTQVLKAYQVGSADEIHIARTLRSLLHGFASLEQRGGFGIPIDLDESFTHMVDTFLMGLHKRYLAKNQ